MATQTKAPSRPKAVRGTLSEERLRELLSQDLKTGSIVTSRGNKISRTHYADLLGCTKSALKRFGPFLMEFERDLGITTGPARHLSNMREWLATGYALGELGLRNGKLDRRVFQKHFGLSNTTLTRHSAIRALLEEYDGLARRDGYLPRARREELDRVQSVLMSQPVLNKDRLTINKVELANAARIPLSRFRDNGPFVEALEVRERQIMAEAQASRIDPYLHGRVFPFSGLATNWPRPFLERVGVRFKQIAAGMARDSVSTPYHCLLDALEWIGLATNKDCQTVLADAAKHSRVLSSDAWEESLFAFRDHLIAGPSKDRAVDGTIGGLRVMLHALTSGGIVPATSTQLPGIKNARRRTGHLRSVAEAGPSVSEDRKTDYVEFARDWFLNACKALNVDIGAGDSREFLEGISAELDHNPNLSDNPAEAVRSVLERRLGALHERATAFVDAAVEAHERGQELLSLARIDVAAFERDYLGSDTYKRQKAVAGLFPDSRVSTAEQTEIGMANFLALLAQRPDGLSPSSKKHKTTGYGQFFAKRYLAYGGLRNIGPMLRPASDTVCAALTLYLIESGANVSVGRTLDRECMEPSDLDDHRRITGHKARARGKPIIVDLPNHSAAVRAMEWLHSVGETLPNGEEDSDRLFLVRRGDRIQMMTPHWYRDWFKLFVESIPGFERVNLTPNMLRPSVLLYASLSNEGRLSTGIAFAQHGISVAQGYQQKWPTRLIYDENIRRFQNAFETLVMASVADAAEKLGITTQEFEARLGDLRATGLGTFCKDQRGRPGQQQTSCTTLDCWNDCPNLLIVAEAEAIAALQLWQTSLRAVQPDWERDRPERWDEVWLPWLCLTNVVEEKMVRGPMIKIWKEAARRAAEISAQPGYTPPLPW